MRIDLYLVSILLAPSRNKAQELIASGRVWLETNGIRQQVQKPSLQVTPDMLALTGFLIHVDPVVGEDGFVSRGGLKLLGALRHLGLDVRGALALDLGISTGGFTDCLLRAGARGIVGIDVGHSQLASALKDDARVVNVEGVNARYLAQPECLPKVLAALQKVGESGLNAQVFDLIVADLSFISLTLVLPDAIQYLKERAALLLLVKPQFEVGREGLGKNGIVKNRARFAQVEAKIRLCCQDLDLNVEDYFESTIEGTDGNREFFVFAKKKSLQRA
jgi:23S rRNA (cytidine1920-2'-O)/16S rRNA (cytidine1409-2'-O)-methyltransferase